eukprot:5377913-Pyramimonas_sp.AAC.1
MECDGILTENKRKWVEELNKHVRRSNTCDGEGGAAKKELHRLRTQWEAEGRTTNRVISIGVLLGARARLKGGAAAGSDGL